MNYTELPYPELSMDVWRDKYRFGDEASPEDTMKRVCNGVLDPSDPLYAETMAALQTHLFVPGGRIIAGAGTSRKVTLMNCYVIPGPEDTMEGILYTFSEYMKTLKAGGGVGFNISTLRPAGTALRSNPGAVSSGPISFAQVFDTGSKTIMAGGCLAGETLLTTPYGHKSIKEIVDNKLETSVRTHKGFRRITGWFNNGEADTVELLFEGGQSIVCTKAHKFHTLDTNGAVCLKPIGEINIGDTCLFATTPTEPVARIPDDISYLLGYYWANGYDNYGVTKATGLPRTKGCAISIPTTIYGETILNQLESILVEHSVPYTVKPGCGACVVLKLNKAAGDWLTSWVGPKGKSHSITVPNGVAIIPFLAGFFNGDGSWRSTKRGPKFCSTSEQMVVGIKRYLMDLGIPSKLTKELRPNGWAPLYNLTIPSQKWQQTFLDTFGEWLVKRGPIATQGKSFNYPPEALYAEKPRHLEWTGKIVEGQRIGHATFESIWPDSPLLEFGGIRLIDIRPAARQTVYDIEVEDTHTYTVGGISVSNSRRGASMMVLDCTHPDIEEFITAKHQAGVLTQFNVSVAVTDAFMQAVAADGPWDLTFEGQVYRTVSAKALWNKILKSTYEFAEPGVLYIDTIRRNDNLGWHSKIDATNPCGEIPLHHYGACNLGAVNLVACLDGTQFNHQRFADAVKLGVNFLDRVLDVTTYPLPAQKARSQFDRHLGLGVMGLGSALALMDINYGSVEAQTFLQELFRNLKILSYAASAQIAKDRGPCPAISVMPDAYLATPNLKGLPTSVLELIVEHGIRNAYLNTAAPTGNTSIFAKNVSGGIEPVFAPRHNRAVLQPDGTKKSYEVVDASLALGASESYFTHNKATALPIDAHLNMLATAQKFIDNSVSKTINVASDISFEEFEGVYTKAYALGCKGCTTYRPSEVRGAVLTEQATPAQTPTSSPISRPRVLSGKTYKIRWDGAAYYVTINDLAPGRPFEFFINSKNKEDLQWVTALTRLASAILRREGNPELLISEFKEVYGVGGEWEKGTFYSTIVNKLGDVLAEHVGAKVETPSYSKCPKCGSHEIVHSEGCITCTACGYSKCG